jgi:hypothetical protein
MESVRADPDFTAYVVARWTPVVRVLVVLGETTERAADQAVTSFARMLPDWSRLRREGDVDVELARLVLDGWVKARSKQPVQRVAVTVPAVPVLTQELEERLAMLQRLVEGLDRLDEATRVTVVLHHLGELDHDQVADVLGEPRAHVARRLADGSLALDLGPLDPACHLAATAIDAPPPSVTRVVGHANTVRRRQWLVALAAVGALALAAGAAFVVTRPTVPDEPDALAVSPVENVVDTPWWLDGTLHLAHGSVEVHDIAQLVETGNGVVFADSAGALTSISDDGIRLDLGNLRAGSTLVSQPRAGWVAWILPDGGDTVVYDASRDREIGRVEASVDAKLIGFDRERLYYHSQGVDWVVTVNGDLTLSEPDRLSVPEGAFGSALLDVSSGTQLRSARGVLDVIQPLYSVEKQVPGTVGQLSDDGNFVLTRVGDHVAMTDARDGTPDGDWFSDQGWRPVAAAFTTEGRVTWVVDTLDGGYGLFECQASRDYINSMDPESQPCTQRYDIDAVPVLAGSVPGINLVSTQ